MMTDNAIYRSLPTSIGSAQTPTYLTVEALLTYCEMRLRGLDDQVQSHFATQRKANDDSAVLSKLASSLNACPDGFAGSAHVGHDLARAYQAAICEVGPDTALGQALIRERDAFIGAAGTPEFRQVTEQSDFWEKPVAANADVGLVKGLNQAQMKAFLNNLSGLQSGVNQGAELGMMTLQSLMSSRQSSVQIVTSLVQSLGEQLNKIAANIGR